MQGLRLGLKGLSPVFVSPGFAVGALAFAAFGVWSPGPAQAAVITFDQLISGQTSYAFDGDGDGIADVVFSTTDPLGFNTSGPGPNQQFIQEPGLEGATSLNPDLRVDFNYGLDLSRGPISFGVAMSTFGDYPVAGSFSIFNSQGSLIEAVGFGILQGSSSFPEALVSTSVNTGIVSFALFDFDDASTFASRYIIDDFTGEFGSTERPVNTVPGPLPLVGTGMAFIASRKLRKRIKDRGSTVSKTPSA